MGTGALARSGGAKLRENLDMKGKEARLHKLEQDLLSAIKAPRIELTVAEIKKKGLIKALREKRGQSQ